MGDGGIWRADLFMVLSEPGRPVFHFHPKFEDGDVGERYELPELDEDPRRWIADQLVDITGLLQRSGAGDLAPSVDLYEHRQAMPHIMSAIDSCLARVPAAIGLSYAATHGAATWNLPPRLTPGREARLWLGQGAGEVLLAADL